MFLPPHRHTNTHQSALRHASWCLLFCAPKLQMKVRVFLCLKTEMPSRLNWKRALSQSKETPQQTWERWRPMGAYALFWPSLRDSVGAIRTSTISVLFVKLLIYLHIATRYLYVANVSCDMWCRHLSVLSYSKSSDLRWQSVETITELPLDLNTRGSRMALLAKKPTPQPLLSMV